MGPVDDINPTPSLPSLSESDLEEKRDTTVEGAPATADEAPSRAGRYRLEGEIARGGMGVVYRATDPELQRPLAVKVLLAFHKDRPEFMRRFLEETLITGQL